MRAVGYKGDDEGAVLTVDHPAVHAASFAVRSGLAQMLGTLRGLTLRNRIAVAPMLQSAAARRTW